MNDEYLNKTGLQYYHNRIKTVFATKAEVPATTSSLQNDGDGNSPFATNAEVDSAIEEALADITSFSYEVVASLPDTGEKGKIYLVANDGGSYDEYIYVENGGTNSFEKIGSTDIDLSNNWDQSNLTAITTAEIDTIVEG